MQTYTTAAAVAADASAPLLPLVLAEAAAARRAELAHAVRRAGPARREAATGAVPPVVAALLARHAMADRRPARDRVMDRIADGLMADLGW